jgi:hypothetical protein
MKSVLTTNEKRSNSQELRLTGKTQRTVQSHGLTTRLSKGSIRLGAFRYVKTEEEASVTQYATLLQLRCWTQSNNRSYITSSEACTV